jgi:hypothetical protein
MSLRSSVPLPTTNNPSNTHHDPPAPAYSLSRMLEHRQQHLVRPTFFPELPEVFMGHHHRHDNADLQRILRMSLMEHVHMSFPAPPSPLFHSYQSQQQQQQNQQQVMGTTAAHPISLDDETTDLVTNGNDHKTERSSLSMAHQVSHPPMPRHDEYQNDLEEAIRLSLLESNDDNGRFQRKDVASTTTNDSGTTSSNPVYLDDDDDRDHAIQETAMMDRKPAAIIARPVSTENE